MGYYVIVGGEVERSLASLKGWADFKRWLYGFDPEYFQSLQHLCEYGWTQDLSEFSDELELMMFQEPPKDIAEVVQNLIDAVRAAPPGAASILLTDGTVTDDAPYDPNDYIWYSGDDDDEDDVPAKPAKKSSKKSATKKTAAKKSATKKPVTGKLVAKKKAAASKPVKKTAKKPAKPASPSKKTKRR